MLLKNDKDGTLKLSKKNKTIVLIVAIVALLIGGLVSTDWDPISSEEKTAAIQALVTDIRNMVAKGLTYMEQAEKDRASLKAYAKGTYINSKALVNYAKQALASDSIQIANQEAMLDKFDVLHVDVNSGIERLSQELNIDHEELVTLLKKMGYTQAQITIMTAADIKEAIKKNTKVTKEEDQKILDAINKVDTDLNAAKTEIVEVLDRIDGHIVDLTNAVKDGIKMQKKQNFIANAYAQQIAFNTGVTAYNQGITNIKLDKLNEAVNNVTIDNSDLAEKFDSLYVAIKTADENNQLGDASIVKAIEALTAFGISQAKLEAMSNEEILAELKKQTELLKESAATLKDLKKQQADGIISAKEYATKVIDILSGLKQDVASLALAIGDLSVNVEAATNKYDDALEAIKNNTQNTAFYVKKLYEAYENRAADIIALKTGMEELKPLLKNIDGTTTNIYQYLVNQGIDKDDIDRILKAIAKSSGDQIDASNANTTKILNAIDKADAKLDAQLQVEQEILAKMNDLANNTSPTNVDLSKVEKGLADILAAIRGLDISNPNYTSLLEEIRDKIKPCNCNCGELKVVVEEIKTIIEQRNSDEGIRNPNGGLIS